MDGHFYAHPLTAIDWIIPTVVANIQILASNQSPHSLVFVPLLEYDTIVRLLILEVYNVVSGSSSMLSAS